MEEKERSGFISLQETEHSSLGPQELCCPLGDGESSYSQAEIHDCSRIKVVTVFLSSAKFQRVKLLTRLGCGELSGGPGLLIMMSYSSPFNLVSSTPSD